MRRTERLLRALHSLEVERFAFASTILVHAAARPGERIDENRPLDLKLPYRRSQIETERLIDEKRSGVPAVHLRMAGVYDDLGRNPFLAHQIARLYERDPKAHFYRGDLATGQSFLHIQDLVNAVHRIVERRMTLPPSAPLLLGEPDVMSYGELQTEISRLLHGEDIGTLTVPKPLAKAGSWLEEEALGRDTFIKPWMAEIADDHYPLDISRAHALLSWTPELSLRETLEALKTDPVRWYKANKLDPDRISGARPGSP